MKESRSLFIPLCFLCLLLTGCGGTSDSGPAVYPVTGTVSLDGEPIPEGAMVFLDPEGKRKSFGARIENGQYSTEMTPGKKKVEITATRTSETKMEPGPSGGPPVPATEQYIPPQYNTETTLEIEVSPDDANTFPFDLKTGQ